jgi:FAD/FMN-containing dehydrogenase
VSRRGLSRRDFITACGVSLVMPALSGASAQVQGTLVNDAQTAMNPTRVARVISIHNLDEARALIREANTSGRAIAIAGARHASGGQQFRAGQLLIDTRSWNAVSRFDQERGLITVSGGIEWPDLMSFYLNAQKGKTRQWGIAQKQGGLDRLTIGGTLSANAHGHTLYLPPIVANVESFELLDAEGKVQTCSRETNPELFRCAIGGYGLFGLISAVTLRLAPRQKLRRNVQWANLDEVVPTLESRAATGSLYGDYQYSIDETSPDFVHRGILTTFDPAGADAVADEEPRELPADALEGLLLLAHTDRAKAFKTFAEATLASSGEVVWSDTHQYSPYPAGYHRRLDQTLRSANPGSDPLGEVYVPRDQLATYLGDARRELLARKSQVVYGTVRSIKRDSETFLAWAKHDYACVIFTLHTDITDEGIARTSDTFRALISMAVARGGSYYLTYNRFADRKLLDAAYPQFSEFLQLKKKYDPKEIFQSDWYRGYLDPNA